MASRPYSQAQGKAQTKWESKAYFKTLVRFPKDAEELIRKAANGNLNGYITQLILDDCGYNGSFDDTENEPFEELP